MVSSRTLIEMENKYGARNYAPLDVVLTRGKGVWVWDVEGKRYLDCLASYSACNQGHCHPKILKAMLRQARRLALTSRAFRNDQLGLLYRDLCDMTNSHMVLLMNSGAEAVESVIKAVRKWGYKVKKVPEGKAEIIVCANNFHGRTITIVGFSTEAQYRDGYEPFTPGFRIVPYGDTAAMEKAMSANTVAVLIEPVQGEGGIIIPPKGYLREVRQLCTARNVMLVLDEIQTGLGRTGKLLAEEHEGIQSDITLIGKALSGGFYPVSAVLSNKEVLGVFHPGDHGSTFGGNPLACAIARAALAVLRDEGIIQNAARVGEYLLQGLRRIRSPYIKEVRGIGLMIGVELHPDAGGARRFCERLMQNSVLCKETHDNVIRFTPPLVITEREVDWALARIEPVLVDPDGVIVSPAHARSRRTTR